MARSDIDRRGDTSGSFQFAGLVFTMTLRIDLVNNTPSDHVVISVFPQTPTDNFK